MIDEKKLLEELRKQKENHERDCELFKGSEYASLIIARLVDEVEYIEKMVEEQPKVGEWIPFKTREADEEEKEAYGWEGVLCCKLPNEDEEILVSYASGYVGTDIFMWDGTECYLESGAEFMTEAIAWRPLPEPYREG